MRNKSNSVSGDIESSESEAKGRLRTRLIETSSMYAKNAEHLIGRRDAGVDVEAIMELVTNNTQQKNWKGILLALLVILIISAFITVASVLTTPPTKVKNHGKPLPNSFKYLYRKMSLNSIFLDNGFIMQDPNDKQVKIFQFNTNETIELFTDKQMKQYSTPPNLEFSSNMDSVLMLKKQPSIFRYSFKAFYEIREYDKNTRTVKDALTIGSDSGRSQEDSLVNFVILSSQKGKLAFSKDEQVYYYDNIFEDPHKFIQASAGLPVDNIRYGTPDWMYEEEIFRSNTASWWSKDSTNLAFAGFDTNNVTTHKIYRYSASNQDDLQEDSFEFNYPKAGEIKDHNTPIVNIYIHNTIKKETIRVYKPAVLPSDVIVSFVKWISDDHLLVIWLDREQVDAWLTITSVKKAKTWIVYKDTAQGGYSPFLISMDEYPFVDTVSKSIYFILPKKDAPEQYRGIASLKLDLEETNDNQSDLDWILWPDFDIDRIVHIETKNREVFFESAGKRTEQNHLFWYKENVHEPNKPTCLSCGDVNCTFSNFQINTKTGHILQNCLGPVWLGVKVIKMEMIFNKTTNIPYLNQTTLQEIEPKFNPVLAGYALPKRKFIELELRKGTNRALNVTAEVVTPAEFDETSHTKYPLLLYTYAGPTRRFVRSEYKFRTPDQLAATLKIVVLIVDGRGTYGRGKSFENEIYKNLGNVEIQDQLDAIKVFVDENKMINKSHIAAYGWSYGGFTVGHLLAHEENENLIKCGIAVAPVTDFRFYNTAYTERYLGRYTKNQYSYFQTSIIRKAKNFKNKKLLLVHGMADDNVHFIQSTKLVSALLDENIDFDYLFYPDEDHSLRNVYDHLLVKKEDFLRSCFNIVDSLNIDQ